jgi:wyosine [tRNA(Phe)-imidazoG37] synthetase (radical SAM superfamily)
MIAFGPIPSRRLGRSLGVNNIPPKVCNYSCVYCQIGLTDSMSIERKEFYPAEEIVKEIFQRVAQLNSAGERIDYITFVPDGEPTLDINIGKVIQLIKPLGIKIAVITNSSLLWNKEVREDLLFADWVSVKIDTVDERVWHKINRPYGKLDLLQILSGIKAFRLSFKGTFVTETMLVKGLNENEESITSIAEFIAELNPDKAYILVPTRPPAEKFVEPPSEKNLNRTYQIFNSITANVELITGSGEVDFTYSSDVEKELLNILAVHPMRKDAVEIFLQKAGEKIQLIDTLINQNKIKEVLYLNNIYYVRYILKYTHN